jgi:hypothetical protein
MMSMAGAHEGRETAMSEEQVRALSVRELVRQRLGADADRWHLALVQRSEVWDQVRMRYLLDSLLEGYPIGSLLLCRVTGLSRVIRLEGDRRVLEEAGTDSWQLLDGQQRINALFSLFTGNGRYGRFFLHMTARRDAPAGPVTTRRAREQSLRYIYWQEEPESERAIPERDRHIDLSRWYSWAEQERGTADAAASVLATGSGDTLRLLNTVDPEFADSLDATDLEVAWHRLRRLLDVWRQPVIPVQYLTLGSPLHVLEVFTRINRAGVQVAGEDLFFAAVKTLWGDAEQVVARVVERLGAPDGGPADVTPLVGRLGALRTLARLAALAAGQSDVLPLTVDRLSGTRGDTLVNVMQVLSDPDGPALRRMATVLGVVTRSSALGFGLYSVDERLWDDVLAWAAVNGRAEDAGWVRAQLSSIDAYLLGATSFRYPTVLRDSFSRVAMIEALTAGLAAGAFPAQRIAEVTRTGIRELREGRTRVRGSAGDEDRLWLADANASLFLSILQSIPYQPQRDVFDWDHIFPQNQASLMWSPGPEGRWRRHHPHRNLVGSAGNLWGLDARANRTAKDLLPGAKFTLIEHESAPRGWRVWPRERWWLTGDEIAEFSEIGQRLQAGHDIDAAMDRFRALVTHRALRMTTEVFAKLPEAELFAADKGGAGAEASRSPRIAEALGVEIPRPVRTGREPIAPAAPDQRVEQVLLLADQRGTGGVLRDLVARATALRLQVRGYQSTITLTPPTTRAIALVALGPHERRAGLVTTWVNPRAFADHFTSVPAERFDEELGGIRGSLLDGVAVADLADRLERLLGPVLGSGLTEGT